MLFALNYWHGRADNPKKSRIAGKSTTILVPAGVGGSYPNVPTTSLAISKYSTKKKAAWLYIAWMTRQGIMLEGQKAAITEAAGVRRRFGRRALRRLGHFGHPWQLRDPVASCAAGATSKWKPTRCVGREVLGDGRPRHSRTRRSSAWAFT